MYPDIGLAILRHEQAAPARVWLLLKHIDQRGRGWLPITKFRERLTGHSEGLRLCGWRQLRKLLARGEGLFWRRSPDRIWLRGVTKVARSLGVPRLTGHPIRLPVEACLKGIGPFRAHLYASFHSGRGNGQATNKTGGPISRASLSARSGVTAQSQRNYERRAGIRRLRNYAVGGHASPAEKQERAWLHGRASFEWIDHNGRLGRRSARYTAWQLPNSYHGPHSKRAKGQQKRINRKLADLFMKGMTGNDEPPIEQVIHHRKRFHNRGSSAASHYRRTSNQTIYWRSRAGRSGHYRLWHVLLPREKQLACG